MVCKILFSIIYFLFVVILIFFMKQLITTYGLQTVEDGYEDQYAVIDPAIALQQLEQQSDINVYGI